VFQSEEIGARERWWGLFGDWCSIYPLLFFPLTVWTPFPLALALALALPSLIPLCPHFSPPSPHSPIPSFHSVNPVNPNPQPPIPHIPHTPQPPPAPRSNPPFPSRLSSSSHPQKLPKPQVRRLKNGAIPNPTSRTSVWIKETIFRYTDRNEGFQITLLLPSANLGHLVEQHEGVRIPMGKFWAVLRLALRFSEGSTGVRK